MNDIRLAEDNPWEYFSKHSQKDLFRRYHPDSPQGDATLFTRAQAAYKRSQTSLVKVGDHSLLEELESGDLRKIYRTEKGIVKIPIVENKTVSKLVNKEIDLLQKFSKLPGKFPLYFPQLHDKISDTIVTGHPEKIYTLSQIFVQNPSLEGRHVVWMLKRIMTALGLVHDMGWIHGAITPEHIMFAPKNHGGVVCGWALASPIGEKITIVPAKYKSLYSKGTIATPRLDCYMLSKCFTGVYPGRIRGFLKGLESCDDILSAITDLDECAFKEYGKPKFVELTMEN